MLDAFFPEVAFELGRCELSSVVGTEGLQLVAS